MLTETFTNYTDRCLEGDKAFIRLQEQLVQISTDHSVLVWQRRGEDFERIDRDMLFATSPDDFKIGKRIVHWHQAWGGSATPNSHHRLTNKGIEFNAIRFVESKIGCFVVLRCRFEDDLRGPLALRLCQKDSRVSPSDIEEMVKRGEFWIGPPEHGHKMQYDTLFQTRRLIIYGGFDAIKEDERPVTVLRQGPDLYSQRDHYPEPKIWIKKSTSSSEDFEIIAADPSKAWNLATGVMCPPDRRKRKLSSVLRGDEADVTDVHGNCCSAWVHQEEIMGDQVFCIEVSKSLNPTKKALNN